MDDRLKTDVLALKDEMIALRRHFHMYPELGLNERETAGKIEKYLKALGLDVKTGIAGTGIVSLIEGRGPGKTLMLRADMDALPILEKNDIPYRSRSDGVMHACGHDGHMAILLAVAKILNNRKREFSGNVKLVFQPGEEGFAGAFFMINEGVLDNPRVDAALGLHLLTTFPVGSIRVCEGEAMASADMFTIIINGKSGHAGFPDTGIDAVFMAGQVIAALQGIISREIPAQAPAVLHIGKIQGGSASNIIADKVELSGTVRTLNENIRNRIAVRIEEIAGGIVGAGRGKCSVTYTPGYPLLKNDTAMTELVRKIARDVTDPENVKDADPVMGSEDMAFFLEKVPGCFFYVGAANDAKGLNRFHHQEYFDFDEDALTFGAETMARTALAYLVP